MADYNYTQSGIVLDSLEQQIADQSFAVNLTGCVYAGNDLTVSFDGSLTAGEETTLGGLVSSFSDTSKPGYPSFLLKDGVDEPATQSNGAQIYVDAADGDLKIKFGDGTVKTIVTDTP